ncbi:MAG: hypothetical protein JOZ65_25130 [Chloroflexi bacterium]|nr:hypothetical protein [Chloroflexota bacterium]
MGEAPRSNRPTPRTAAAIEAELRRRIRGELEQAREAANGELDDATLAAILARAVAAAVQWHLEAPEHTRNATLSSRTWRPSGGPRGGGGERGAERDFDQRPRREARDFDRPPRDFNRPPRDFDRPPRDFDRPPRDFDRPPRDFDRPPRNFDRPPRDFDRPRRDFDRPPRDNDRRPRGGGGFSKRGGFGPRRPRSR